MFKSEADAFCRMQNSPRTQQEYRKDLERWFNAGFDLTVDGVSKYRDYLSTNYRSSSAGRFYSTAKTFYRWLVQRGMLDVSPFEAVKAPRRVRDEVVNVPSDTDVNALIGAAKTPREAAVISLLLNGLRASEVTTLSASSVKFAPQFGWYMVVLGKGNRERIVPMLDETVEAIRAFEDWAPETDSPWLVHNADGSQLTYDAVNGIVDMAARRAGVDIHPHLLRHHYGTRLVRAGANVFAVQKLLGHSNVQTTQRYVTMDFTDLVEASRKDPRNRKGLQVVSSNSQDSAATGEDSGRPAALQLASA